MEGSVSDTASTACGAIFGSTMVNESRELPLAEMCENVEDNSGKGKYVGGLGVGLLMGLPCLDHGGVGI